MGTTGGKFTVAGAVAIILGSLLSWTTIPLGGGYSYRGTMLSMSVFFDWGSMNLASSFIVSTGMLIALLGVVSLAGLYMRRPWVTWVSGGIVTVALGLLIIRFIGESGPDPGLLLGFAGGIAVLAGSFLSQRAAGAST